MAYKNKEKQREATVERVRRYRNKQKGVTLEGVTGEGVTPYHPLMYALVDSVKRKKLQDICEALGRRNLCSDVYYGCGKSSISMDLVEGLLEATNRGAG